MSRALNCSYATLQCLTTGCWGAHKMLLFMIYSSIGLSIGLSDYRSIAVIDKSIQCWHTSTNCRLQLAVARTRKVQTTANKRFSRSCHMPHATCGMPLAAWVLNYSHRPPNTPASHWQHSSSSQLQLQLMDGWQQRARINVNEPR